VDKKIAVTGKDIQKQLRIALIVLLMADFSGRTGLLCSLGVMTNLKILRIFMG
jgi:hypothetical protein